MTHAELADDHQIRVGRKRAARLKRAAGLRGATLRRFIITTQPDLQAQRAIDLVDRKFYTDESDRLWVAEHAFGKRCQEVAVMPSMDSVEDEYANAMAESFFARAHAGALEQVQSFCRLPATDCATG